MTFLPSRPANGPSLILNVMESVGGSIGVAASGPGRSIEPIVSGTVASVSPATAMMSPALTSSTATRSSPRNESSFVSRPVSTTLPSSR